MRKGGEENSCAWQGRFYLSEHGTQLLSAAGQGHVTWGCHLSWGSLRRTLEKAQVGPYLGSEPFGNSYFVFIKAHKSMGHHLNFRVKNSKNPKLSRMGGLLQPRCSSSRALHSTCLSQRSLLHMGKDVEPCFWLLFGGSVMSNSFATPMDYSPPGSSVHGILQARILEWVAICFSRESS